MSDFLPANEVSFYPETYYSNQNQSYCFCEPGSYYFNKEIIVYLPCGIPFTISSGYSFLFEYGFYVIANDMYYLQNVNYYQLNSENMLEEVLDELCSKQESSVGNPLPFPEQEVSVQNPLPCPEQESSVQNPLPYPEQESSVQNALPYPE